MATWNAIYLGTFTTLDPLENSYATSAYRGDSDAADEYAENAGLLVGQTFGGPNSTGLDVVSVTTDNRVGSSTVLDQDQAFYGQDYFLADLNGDGVAERYAFDATVSMTTTVRFLDGSTRSLTLTYFQATTGQLFLAPSLNATTNATLTSGTISSLTITGIATTGGTTINQGGAYSDGLTIARPNVALTVTCFAAGTMITTPDGPRPVETLRPGDLVVTRDRGPQPLRWIGRQSVDDLHAPERERLRPIRIRRGALGDGAPSSDLLVSPQHRILVRSAIARRMFGAEEILVAAKHLLAVNGFEVANDLATVTYVHLMFDRHEIVISNGAETESLFTGPEALKALPAAAIDEIMTLFPELRDVGQRLDPARPLAPGRPARRLADRHATHGKPLVAQAH